MSQKLKRCKIKNLTKTISNISGKSLSEVEDEMVYCNLYPENEDICLRRFEMTNHDGDNWFNNTLNRILDINKLECLYITKNEELFNLEKAINNFETLTTLGKELFDNKINNKSKYQIIKSKIKNKIFHFFRI